MWGQKLKNRMGCSCEQQKRICSEDKKKKRGGGMNHTAENLDIKQEKPVSSVMNMMKELNIFMRK